MQWTIAAGSSGRTAPALQAAARIRSGMLSGAVNAGSSALIRGPPGGKVAAASSSSARSGRWPSAAQVR